MNRIDRLFGITTILQSKKYVPAEQMEEVNAWHTRLWIVVGYGRPAGALRLV